MNFIELEQITPALIKSGKSLLIKSSPGLGKSQFTEGVPTIMSKLLGTPFGFQSIFAATQTPTDLMGFMVPEKRDDGKLVSSFTLPHWMRTNTGGYVWDHEYGMLVIEEWGQGEAETKRAMAELLLNKRLGSWTLPPKWVVWALTNHASDRSGVTKDFDFLINRRVEVEMRPDLAAWERWALANGVGPIFITFARQNPQIVFSEGVPEKQGPWCTPRSLVADEQVLMNLSDEDGKIPTSSIAKELSAGTIGMSATAQLFATIELAHVMPDFNDIVRNPASTQVPDRPDARMLVCYSLAHRVTEATMDPVLTYVERFPKEFAITFAKSAVRRDDTLIDTASFAKFCVNNQSLLGVIARAKL